MKVFIFGGPGSGKTTYAKRLSNDFGITHYELDRIFSESGARFEQNREDIRSEIVKNLVIKKDWIIEGMYRQDWLNEILSRADVIFVLRVPKIIRNVRTTIRTFKQLLGLYSDRPVSFGLFFDFIRTNREFDNQRLDEFYRRLNIVGKKCVVVGSYAEMVKVLKDTYDRGE